MSRISGACVLVTALASAFGISHHSESETRHYVDGALGEIASNMTRLNGSLDKVIRLLEERPTATIDLHGQRQSMIVVTPVPPGAVDVQALAREALVKIQERENGETVGNEQRDALLHLGGPAGD